MKIAPYVKAGLKVVAVFLAIGLAFYVFKPPPHTIDTITVHVDHPEHKEVPVLLLVAAHKFTKTQLQKSAITVNGVVRFKDVPQGNYSLFVPTDLCTPKGLGNISKENYGLFVSFGFVSNDRWMKPESVEVKTHLASCSVILHFKKSLGWVWEP
ncbi:MAG: hypothetical protein Q8R36_04095 [bacterium]|nr:hypothetical protein [bacterium]